MATAFKPWGLQLRARAGGSPIHVGFIALAVEQAEEWQLRIVREEAS